MTSDIWYFAYGSNLNPPRMEERTGKIRRAERCRLCGYKLSFNKLGTDGSGKANIIPDEESEVWGVAYICGTEAMDNLDLAEGFPKHYERHKVWVVLDSGEKLESITYIACKKRLKNGLKPSPDYVNHILEGARHHQLPSNYILRIESLG